MSKRELALVVVLNRKLKIEAERAARAAKRVAQIEKVKKGVKWMVQSAIGRWVLTTIKKTASLCASFATTTISYGVLVRLTLWFDVHGLHELFEMLSLSDATSGFLFHNAKYVAIAIELWFWLKGVYRDCKDHYNHK